MTHEEKQRKPNHHVSRLAFGSCTSQQHPNQPFWSVIQNRSVSAFVWAGDAVYADDRVEWNGWKRKVKDGTPSYLNSLYDKQRNFPGYKTLLQRNLSIFGTIDDHDYGRNNGDRTLPWRRENGIEFIKFLGLSNETAITRRVYDGKGVYGVQVYDFSRSDPNDRLLTDVEAGLDPDVITSSTNDDDRQESPPSKAKDANNNKLVAVFVLDIRSNRAPWPKALKERFSQNAVGDFLGEEQYRWFETAIGRSNAAVNIVVTGLQVHAERFYDGSIVENWSGFPNSQHRFYQALLQPNVQAPILITGDVHHAQIMRKDCRKSTSTKAIRPLYEVTTSGMTHAWGSTLSSTCGRNDLSPLCRNYYFRKMWGLTMHLAHRIIPWKELIVDEKTKELQYSLELNIAELEFDWEGQRVQTTILGPRGETLLQQFWSFNHLNEVRGTFVREDEFATIAHQLEQKAILHSGADDWICVHYRGIPSNVNFFLGLVSSVIFAGTLWLAPFLLSLFLLKRLMFGTRQGHEKRKIE